MDERDIVLRNNTEQTLDGSGVSAEYYYFKDGTDSEAISDVSKILEKQKKLLFDMTWQRQPLMKDITTEKNIPYVRLNPTNWQLVQAADDYISSLEGSDAALVFTNEEDLDQGLEHIIGRTFLRIIVLNGLDNSSTPKLMRMRPNPSNYVIFGNANNVEEILYTASNEKLLTRDSRWILVLQDFGEVVLSDRFHTPIVIIKPNDNFCCKVDYLQSSTPSPSPSPTSLSQIGVAGNCSCTSINVKAQLVTSGLKEVLTVLTESSSADNIPQSEFDRNLEEKLESLKWLRYNGSVGIYVDLEMDVGKKQENQQLRVGDWKTVRGYQKDVNVNTMDKLKRLLVVGTVKSEPFAYETGEVDKDGKPVYEGYCIELLRRIAQEMHFDFTVKFPADGLYGVKSKNGTWDGVIGELMRGEIDMIVAGLSMTSEREEVVDFVSPYFDQAGISIIMRRKMDNESLFKFLSVLNWKVWLSMVGAIFVTGLVLWIVDRTSPYSAQNNKSKYPNSRIFNLKESFWFALTSFTPQGGGETPKSVSARCLVAAYWLFVVLMLATFTANLAAFLTVERMKTPIASLDELSRQSAVKYSVVESTSIHQYFKSMKMAEEELYQMWKDATLRQSISESKFRVWDYPIHERYGDLLDEIDSNDPVKNDTVGMERVRNKYEGHEFALIHDSNKVRYEVYRDCNLTEVGRPFAEQPYAIAVRTGSPLRHKVSEVVLRLQKNRYLEILNKRYWDPSRRRTCVKEQESEGITLHNVGGIFIGVGFGITVAFVILIGERYFGWCQSDIKRSSSAVQPISIKPSIISRSDQKGITADNKYGLATVNF
ncbi:Uncharacterised protein g7909 [Pycnogonum litorale]